MKVALIHDWLLGLGGAERVLKILHEMFPEAPVYTFFYNKKFTGKFLSGAEIRSSFLQKFYRLGINHKLFLPFLPIAAETFDFSAYNLVISSSIAFSKGLILKPKTKHICYCYSPTRFLWDWQNEYSKNQNWGIKTLQHFLRLWDKSAADRVDEFIAISKNVQQRIKKYYNRDSVVIYPPIQDFRYSTSPDLRKPTGDSMGGLKHRLPETSPLQQGFVVAQNSSFCQETIADSGSLTNRATRRFERPQKYYSSSLKDYFLVVSRLFPHKNIDIAIQAFNKLELPLVIVGDGPERKKLKSMIENKNLIKMMGNVSDENLVKCYQECKAFIMPQEEDFGLTPIEAMSFGKPVLALKKGGALEYILEEINGEFFEDPHPAVLADGVRRLNENYKNYSPLVIKKTAERFSRQRFEEEIKNLITTL